MPRLAQMISENLVNCDILQFTNAVMDIRQGLEFRMFLYDRSKLYDAQMICKHCEALQQIAQGRRKINLNKMNQLINRLEKLMNAFETLQLGYPHDSVSPIRYRYRTIGDYATVRYGEHKVPLITMLRTAVNECAASFQVYTLYPYINRYHKNPVQGASLPDNETYANIRTLSGDDLKTAILEVMFDKLAAATTDNFEEINEKIIGSEAYRILSTSQSATGIYGLFNAGKTTSQTIIDNHLDQKRREFVHTDQVQPEF